MTFCLSGDRGQGGGSREGNSTLLEGIDGISITDGEVCKINKSHMDGVIYNNFLSFYPTGLNYSHVFILLGFANAAFGCE